MHQTLASSSKLIGFARAYVLAPALVPAQDEARSSSLQARNWVAGAAMAHSAAAAGALAPASPLWGPVAAHSDPNPDLHKKPRPHRGAMGALPPRAAPGAGLDHREPERSGRPPAPHAARSNRSARCHASVQTEACAESATVADGMLSGSTASEAAEGSETAARDEPTAKRQCDGVGEAAAAADAAAPKRQLDDVVDAAAAAADQAAAKRQRSRESAAAMQPLPLPEGLGDAAAAAAAYRPEMAEMRALLAAHGVELPSSRFDSTDAELFRFAATMGLLKARSPDERCVQLRAATSYCSCRQMRSRLPQGGALSKVMHVRKPIIPFMTVGAGLVAEQPLSMVGLSTCICTAVVVHQTATHL